MGLMALTGCQLTEIFFNLIKSQLKTRQAPDTSFEPYPIPVLAEPKLIIRAPSINSEPQNR
jgi:hypothetical protein